MIKTKLASVNNKTMQQERKLAPQTVSFAPLSDAEIHMTSSPR